MLRANAGQLHAFASETAQEQRARRIELFKLAQIEYARRFPLYLPLQRFGRCGKRADIEHAFESELIAVAGDGDGWQRELG